MQSILAEELKLKYYPVAILFTDERPENARQIKEGSWGCAMALYLVTMTKGHTAVFDRATHGCVGAGVGLCFGDTYKPNSEFMDNLLSDQEAYFKSRELVHDFTENFPFVDIPQKYVVFKPLDQIDESTEKPALMSVPGNADQISALAALLNFRRPGNDHVSAPFCAGCQSVCVMPYNQIDKEYPKAILGNLDLSSRRVLPADIMTFTVPFRTYLEMEEDVPVSFMRKNSWLQLARRLQTR